MLKFYKFFFLMSFPWGSSPGIGARRTNAGAKWAAAPVAGRTDTSRTPWKHMESRLPFGEPAGGTWQPLSASMFGFGFTFRRRLGGKWSLSLRSKPLLVCHQLLKRWHSIPSIFYSGCSSWWLLHVLLHLAVWVSWFSTCSKEYNVQEIALIIFRSSHWEYL